MAGIFESNVEGVMGSAVSPEQAVSRPKNLALGMLAGAVGVGSDMFKEQMRIDAKKEEEATKAKAEAFKSGVLADINNQIEAYGQAYKTGAIGRDRFNTKISVLNKKAVASNPALVEDINKMFSTKLGGAWIGGQVKEKTESEVVREKLLATAVSLGAVTPDMSPDEVDFNLSKVAQYQSNAAMLKEDANKLAYINAKLTRKGKIQSMEQSAWRFEKEVVERQMTDRLYQMFPFEYDAVRNDLVSRFDTFNSGPRTAQDKTNFVNELAREKELKRKQIVMLGKANPEVQSVLEPLLAQYDMYSKMASAGGEEELKGVQDELKLLEGRAKLAFMQNMTPQERSFVVNSRMVPYAANLQAKAGKTSMDVIARMYQTGLPDGGNANPVDGTPEASEHAKAIIDGFSRANNKGDSLAVDEYKAQANNYLQNVVDYSGKIKSMKNIKPAIEMMANPEFKKLVESGAVKPETAEAIKRVYQTYYTEHVLKTAEKVWEGGRGALPANYRRDITYKDSGDGGKVGTAPYSYTYKDELEPVFNGSGVSFVAKGGYKLPPNLNEDENLRQLSRSLNTLIKSKAHLEGTDYKTQFETFVKPYVFGIVPEGKDGSKK